PEWYSHKDCDEITPAGDTAAIVVDARTNEAAIRIFDSTTKERVGFVGIEEQGNVVIVPWRDGWYYFCTRSPRVAHVKK
ncbi:hypothetical protein M406DRAFT_235029, partial [Cryphonectria parasitica EP155]